jgi:hypothetical protein
MVKRKKKRKPLKFKPVVFKLTLRQKKSLETHCKERNLTMIKLIKKSIHDFLTLQPHQPVEYEVSPNQLDLFENQTVEYLKKQSRVEAKKSKKTDKGSK